MSTIEKIELYNGTEWILDRSRLTHRYDGRTISGYIVEPDGEITLKKKVTLYSTVKRHVAMKYDLQSRSLVEDMDQLPFSLR